MKLDTILAGTPSIFVAGITISTCTVLERMVDHGITGSSLALGPSLIRKSSTLVGTWSTCPMLTTEGTDTVPCSEARTEEREDYKTNRIHA